MLLFVLYILDLALHYWLKQWKPDENGYSFYSLMLSIMPTAIYLVMNIIIAIFVAKDIRKYGIGEKFLIILTIFYRPLGVCLLLIAMILHKNSSVASTITLQKNELKT